MVKLPADLTRDDLWPVRVCKASGPCCISGGTQCVGAHVADGNRLASGSGSRHCRGILYITHADATCKPTANLLGGVQLSAGERTGPGDESPRTTIIWSLSLKQA